VFNSVIGTFYSLATIAFLLQFNIRNEFLNFLSKISYSIYLSHILFIDQFKNISHSLEIEWPFLSWLIIGFSVSLIGSIIVYLIAKILLKEKSGIIIGA
jgi:peptidoglycan/LPS O-acetylase OafA/YrhL